MSVAATPDPGPLPPELDGARPTDPLRRRAWFAWAEQCRLWWLAEGAPKELAMVWWGSLIAARWRLQEAREAQERERAAPEPRKRPDPERSTIPGMGWHAAVMAAPRGKVPRRSPRVVPSRDHETVRDKDPAGVYRW